MKKLILIFSLLFGLSIFSANKTDRFKVDKVDDKNIDNFRFVLSFLKYHNSDEDFERFVKKSGIGVASRDDHKLKIIKLTNWVRRYDFLKNSNTAIGYSGVSKYGFITDQGDIHWAIKVNKREGV